MVVNPRWVFYFKKDWPTEDSDTHRQYTERSTEQTEQLAVEENSEADAEDYILCGVVAATFRVLWLFVVTCYSYSKTESVITNCSSDW
jgi:hypothetical protein